MPEQEASPDPPAERTKVSGRLTSYSERMGGGVNRGAVTTITHGHEIDWPACDKCGGKRFTGGRLPAPPHAPHLWRHPTRGFIEVDCAGDETDRPENKQANNVVSREAPP